MSGAGSFFRSLYSNYIAFFKLKIQEFSFHAVGSKWVGECLTWRVFAEIE